MKRIIVLALVSGLSTLGSAQAAVGTAGGVTVPTDAAATCAQHCSEIGLSLDSVVIMANNVGCVCRASNAANASSSVSTGGQPAGGMAALMVAAAAERQRATTRRTSR